MSMNASPEFPSERSSKQAKQNQVREARRFSEYLTFKAPAETGEKDSSSVGRRAGCYTMNDGEMS